MSLPGFTRGEPLRAAALNALGNRVRLLQGQMRKPELGGTERRVRCFVPGRHFAFQLAEMNGLVWFRQGWVDAGNGRLYKVGDAEWNALGPLKAMTVWLNMTRDEGSVEAGDYDDYTPEHNTRRRLGYVRVEDAGDGSGAVYHCVQLTGGLMVPAAPRRMMGGNFWNTPTVLAKGDDGVAWMTAGNLRGEDFEEEPGRYYAGRSVGLAYMNRIETLQLPLTHGGNRTAMVLSFGGIEAV